MFCVPTNSRHPAANFLTRTKFSEDEFVFKVTYKEIDEMIETVDKNGDGKISFSEFR